MSTLLKNQDERILIPLKDGKGEVSPSFKDQAEKMPATQKGEEESPLAPLRTLEEEIRVPLQAAYEQLLHYLTLRRQGYS